MQQEAKEARIQTAHKHKQTVVGDCWIPGSTLTCTQTQLLSNLLWCVLNRFISRQTQPGWQEVLVSYNNPCDGRLLFQQQVQILRREKSWCRGATISSSCSYVLCICRHKCGWIYCVFACSFLDAYSMYVTSSSHSGIAGKKTKH